MHHFCFLNWRTINIKCNASPEIPNISVYPWLAPKINYSPSAKILLSLNKNHYEGWRPRAKGELYISGPFPAFLSCILNKGPPYPVPHPKSSGSPASHPTCACIVDRALISLQNQPCVQSPHPLTPLSRFHSYNSYLYFPIWNSLLLIYK